jgi:hypothetical protein
MYSSEDVDQLLQLADNMPLAVNLIAHIADYEGLINVLAHWETEKTSLLSIGSNEKSNLDVSISLSSPRITSHSKNLLSLLALLPNGLSDIELVKAILEYQISSVARLHYRPPHWYTRMQTSASGY